MLGIVILVLVLLPMLLYIPFVQNYVKDVACRKASEATGWDVSVDRILLKFPLDVSISGVMVLDEQRDTMISADNLMLDVKVLPLIRLDVEVEDARLLRAGYRMVSEDSSMVLKARIDEVKVNVATIALNNNGVTIDEALLHGGDIYLDYFPEKVRPSDKLYLVVKSNTNLNNE